jgi:hypothetical protein
MFQAKIILEQMKMFQAHSLNLGAGNKILKIDAIPGENTASGDCIDVEAKYKRRE